MSCRKMNEDLKNLLPESFQNLEEFQLENLIEFLNTNLGESFLSDQIITVFDISSLKALTEDEIRPGHQNVIDVLETGDNGEVLKSIDNPKKQLVTKFDADNRFTYTIKLLEEAGETITPEVEAKLKKDIEEDLLKGKFITEYFNPNFLYNFLFNKKEQINIIRRFLYNVTPYAKIGDTVYLKDSSEFKTLAKTNSIAADNLKFDKSKQYFELLFGNSTRFKSPDTFKEDIEEVSKYLAIQFTKLRKFLIQEGSGKEVKYFYEKYLHSEVPSENVKIGAKLPFVRTVKTNSGIDTDLFLFVSANSEYKNWDSAKKQRYDYILGMYRTVLQSNGVDDTIENPINLFLIPMFFDKGKFDELKIETSVTHRNSETTKSGLEKNGIITKELKRFVQLDPNLALPESNVNLETIHQQVEKLTNGRWSSVVRRQKSKEELKKHILNNKNEKGEYVFYKRIGTATEILKLKNEAEIDTAVDDYLSELEENKYQYTKDVIKTCNTLIESRKQNKETNVKVFGNVADKVQNQVNILFSHYLNGDYIVIDRPEFVSNGIVAFMHTKNKHIDFITLTSEGLNTVHQLAEGGANDIGTTIYGAYCNNEEAYKRFGQDAPSSTTHALEFLKVLTVCNAIPNVFKDCKIGRLQCVNIYSGESKIADSKIISHYSKLTNIIDNPNHLNKDIKILSQEHRWFFELNYLLSQMGDSTLKSTILFQLNTLTNTSYYDYHLLLERVRDLKTSIEDAYNFGSLEINKMMSFHTLPEKLYAAVCALEATYKKFQWENEEDFSTLSLQGGQLLTFIQQLFFNNVSRVSKDNVLLSGFAQGALLTGSSNMPSNILKEIQNILDGASLKVRHETDKECSKIQKYTIDFYNSQDTSTIRRWAWGDQYGMYNDLFEKDATGKLDRKFRVKNPWDMTNGLNDGQRKYLINILWQINKFRISGLTEDQRRGDYDVVKDNQQILMAIADGTYFEIPPVRGNTLSRLHNRESDGLVDWVKQKGLSIMDKFKEFSSAFDPRDLDRGHRDYFDKAKENYNKYPNLYKINQDTRDSILESQDVSYWETDLDFIAMNMAFHSAKEVIFNDVLSTIRSVVTLGKFTSFKTGQDISKYLQLIEDKIKITIFNETLISKEMEPVANIVKTGRKIASTLNISFRPLQTLKELSVGFIRSLSLATTNIIKSDASFTHKQVLDAYLTIFGHTATKAGAIIQANDKDISNFTLVNALNSQYGMANMDLNTIVDKLKSNRFGLCAGVSKWLFWTATYGDFVNRMVLLIAEMKKNGIWDAHKMVDGELVYDMSKDKRFEIYYKHKNNTDCKLPEFKKQKALYLTMMDEFIQDGYKNKDGKLLKYGDDLPKAYTTSQRNSIKELADTMYGCYDHELKTQAEHTITGLLFFQYKTYWSGVMRRYFALPGTKTSRGKYVQAKDEQGNLLYRKPIYDESGKVIVSWEITTENPDNKFDELYVWEGDFMEGMMVSILKTLKDCGYFVLNKFGITNQPISFERERLANAALGIHDILIALFLYKILIAIFFGKSPSELKVKDMSDGEQKTLKMLNVLGKASFEFGLDQALLITSFTPSFVSTTQKIATSFIDTLFEDNYLVKNFIIDNISGVKDFAEVDIVK